MASRSYRVRELVALASCMSRPEEPEEIDQQHALLAEALAIARTEPPAARADSLAVVATGLSAHNGDLPPRVKRLEDRASASKRR